MDTDTARRRLEERRKELEGIRDTARNQVDFDQSQDESTGALAHTTADAGTETFEREKELSVVESAEGSLQQVEDALRKLDNGSYGRCEACGEEIAEERLRERPEVRYCIEHQREAETRT